MNHNTLLTLIGNNTYNKVKKCSNSQTKLLEHILNVYIKNIYVKRQLYKTNDTKKLLRRLNADYLKSKHILYESRQII